MAVQCWLSNSLRRHFPAGPPQRKSKLRMLMARGEKASFQVCVHNTDELQTAEVFARVGGADGVRVMLRRVGCVPVPHHNTGTPPEERDGAGHIPGYVPDPLFPDAQAVVAPGETQVFWVTVHVDPEAVPGERELPVHVQVGEETVGLIVRLRLSEVVIRPRRDFPVTQWFYADALCDWYHLEPWSKGLWSMLGEYLAVYSGHGFDTLLTPLLTPPTDGVKRPTQLLHVTKKAGKYSFDWTDVARWVALARRCGIERFEWPHLFTQWGVKHAVRVYDGQGQTEKLLWPAETGATSETYREFLSQLLPEFHGFLKSKKLLDKSFYHVSDEPHGPEHLENYKAARALLAELAPWLPTMDALSEIEYGRQGLTDMPIPSVSVTRQYWEEGIASWTYFCCGPRGRFLNRLLDTPLAKIRMAGWLFYRFRRLGFLHWGFNYWYKSQTRQLIDPYTVTDGLQWPNWAYGDTFLVYPGPEGPVESIRGQVFAESLQDMALLQTLDVDPDGKLLSDLEDFDRFPWDAKWLKAARRKLLTGA